MRKYSFYRITLIILIGIIVNCQNKVEVRVDDYESNLGGRNTVISIQRFPVTLENNVIAGVQKDGSTTAVIFKDETNKLVTNYSNVNKVKMYHIEEWDEMKNFKRLTVDRKFIYYDRFAYFQKIILAPFTFGYSLLFPHEYYFDELHLINKDYNHVVNNLHNNFFENADNSDYSIMVTITNTGDLPIKEEFTVIDILPDFLEFKSVEYLSNGEIKEVAYDLHKNENSQVIPFKIRPLNEGLNPKQSVNLKIKFKPILQKFKVNKYNPNLLNALTPINNSKSTLEANPDSAKESKIEVKPESKTTPSDSLDSTKTIKPKEVEIKSKADSNKEEDFFKDEKEEPAKKNSPVKNSKKKKTKR